MDDYSSAPPAPEKMTPSNVEAEEAVLGSVLINPDALFDVATFLKPEVAADYGVVRGRDRAFINLSVLDPEGTPVPAAVSGTMVNLLSQSEPLRFREVREGEAIYYLAEFKHTDRDTLRFAVDIVAPDGEARQLKFQQRMYWDGQ